jgi:cytochrome c oxidase assembly factor CtaG
MDVSAVQLLVCLVLGAVGVTLVILQFVRNRRRQNTQAVKFFVLGLIAVPALLVLVSIYVGQIWRVVSGGG